MEYVQPDVLPQRKVFGTTAGERVRADERSDSGRSSFRLSRRKMDVEFPKPRAPKRKLEERLARARALIRTSASSDRSPFSTMDEKLSGGEIYHNPAAFFRSNKEMEKSFKLYVYSEGTCL